MRKYALLFALLLGLSACDTGSDAPFDPMTDNPVISAPVGADASGVSQTPVPADAVQTVADTLSARGERVIFSAEYQYRGQFAEPGDEVPFCVQVNGINPLGAKVEFRSPGGDLLAEPVRVGSNGRVYLTITSLVPAVIAPELYVEGRLAQKTRGTIQFREDADEINAPYPLALTPFPADKCLEPATLDE